MTGGCRLAGGNRKWWALFAALVLLIWAGPALANPLGGQVVGGQATISNTAPGTLTIDQTTPRAAIDWQSFNIAPTETTRFVQPSASAIALNRVRAGDPSVIAGKLTANGQLILINPSGILFTKGSQVDVNSLLATPTGISTANFMAGRMVFDQPSSDPRAQVINNGHITVGQAGLAALVAPGVANNGVIAAKLGKVVLGGASTYTLDFYGDGLIQFNVGSQVSAPPLGRDGKPVSSLVSNAGQIDAPGGTVLLTADAARGILQHVIDAPGAINAPTYAQTPGTVTIAAGANAAELSGGVNVSGLRPGQTGGSATITGGSADLTSTARIDARGASGGGTVRIGSVPGWAPGTLAKTALTANVSAGAVIDASATGQGNGGTVSVLSDTTTTFAGTILAKGGPQGGDGGQVETSGGTLSISSTAAVNASAAKGKAGLWVLDPTDLTIDNTAATTISNTLNAGTNVTEQTTGTGTVSGLGTTANGNGDINLTGTIAWSTTNTLTLSAFNNLTISGTIAVTGGGTLVLITDNNAGGASSGNGALAFAMGQGSAAFASEAANPKLFINGSKYTLIYNSGSGADGLQGINSNPAGNYALANGFDLSSLNPATAVIPTFSGNFNGLGNNLTGLTINSAVPNTNVGLFGLVGSSAVIANLGLAGGSVTGAASDNVGGLAGAAEGTIFNSYATVSVNGGGITGGLAGFNAGLISQSYATGPVSGGLLAGGLVGNQISFGAISNSFALGSVSSGGDAGGLVGSLAGTVASSFSTGAVAGGPNTGGLIGMNLGTVSNSYWNITSSGNPTGVGAGGSAGVSGLDTATFASALPAGLSPSVWGNVYNQTTPYLKTNPGPVFLGSDSGPLAPFYTLVFNPTQLQAVGNASNLAGNYALAQDIDLGSFGSFTPIGPFGAQPFAGVFNGLGNVVANLTINNGALGEVGLFGVNSGTISNLGVVGASITNANGFNGILVGANHGGTLTNVYATGAISGGGALGGLAGINENILFSTGTITNAYASVTIHGTLNQVGGLVAANFGAISNSYATSSASATGSNVVGGLVGLLGSSGSISNAYAAVAVSGHGSVGGFVGTAQDTSTIAGSYWNSDRAGTLTAIGSNTSSGAIDLTRLSGAQPYLASSYPEFTFTGTPGAGGNSWVIVDSDGTLNNAAGAAMPMLASEAQSHIENAHQLQLIAMNTGGSYTLGRNIDASATGTSTGPTTGSDVWGCAAAPCVGTFVPLGTPFYTGTFDGGGHTISGLTINSSLGTVGLFAAIDFGGVVKNLGLVGGAITATAASGEVDVGGLAGVNRGNISNAYATAVVSGVSSTSAGGLVGTNLVFGSITQSFAAGAVTGGSRGTAGGLAGTNEGSISQSFAAGPVSGAFAGGLAGLISSNGSVTDVYATGPVTGTIDTGGLVGAFNSGGTITNGYATGAVLGVQTGGLVGQSLGGTVTHGYWDTGTSGLNISAAGTAQTTAQLQAGLPGGFLPSIWGIISTKSYPYLCWQVTNCAQTPQAVSGTVFKDMAATTNAGASITVTGITGGTQFNSLLTGTTVTTGANGYYYYLVAPNTIAANGGVLTYAQNIPVLGGGTASGAALTDQVSGAATGLTILPNALHETTADTKSSVLAASLNTALGSNAPLNTLVNNLANLQIDASGAFDIDDFSIGRGITVLNAGGAVTESTGVIHANALAITAPGAITLGGANAVGKLAASGGVSGNGILFNNTSATLTVDTVNGVAGVTTPGLDITLTASGNIVLNQPVGVAANVKLSAGGSISQASSSGVVTALKLTATATTGTVGLGTFANNIRTVTGSAGGNFLFADSTTVGLTIDPAGISVGAGNQIAVNSTISLPHQELMINGPLSAPGGSVTLAVTGGSIFEQNTGGPITTSALTMQTNLDAGGVLVLLNTANAISGPISIIAKNGAGTTTVAGAASLFNSTSTQLAGIDTLGGVLVQSAGAVTESGSGIVNSSNLTVTTVNDSGAAITLTGSNHVTGNINLTALTVDQSAFAPGDISFTSASNINIAGIGTAGNVTLTATGTAKITESANGIITANTLNASAPGGATLNDANKVTNLGTFNGGIGGAISFTDAQALNVNGPVTGPGGVTLTTTTGNLTLNGNLTATNAAATLNSAGTISQNGGVITAAALTGQSAGGATLLKNNVINLFGPFTNSLGGAISLLDATTFAVSGAVLASSSDVNLTALGNMNIANPISGNNVNLIANGSIVESGGGLISAVGGLNATTMFNGNGGTINLFSQSNSVAFANFATLLGSGTTLAPSSISFFDSIGFGITSGPGPKTGIATNSAVTLNAPFINEVASAAITAGTLAITATAAGGVDLANLNSVNTLAANVTQKGASFDFVNSQALAVGTAGGLSGVTTDGTNGTKANIVLKTTAGDLNINAPVSTNGTAGTTLGGSLGQIGLQAAGKITVNQSGTSGLLVAAAVEAIAGDTINLDATASGGNRIGQNADFFGVASTAGLIAAQSTGVGKGITMVNQNAPLTVDQVTTSGLGTGGVSANTVTLPFVSGAISNGGDIKLVVNQTVPDISASTLTLNLPVNANNGAALLGASPGTVRLIGSGFAGNVTQGAAGTIVAGALDAEAASGFSSRVSLIAAANHIGANDNSSGIAGTAGLVGGTASNGFALTNNNAGIQVDQVGCGCAAGISTTFGGIALTTTGAGIANITLNQSLSAPIGTVTLTAASGSVTQDTTNGAITAFSLTGSSFGASLNAANHVAALGPFTAFSLFGLNAQFDFTNAQALTVSGPLAANGFRQGNAHLTLTTMSGGLTVASDITAPGFMSLSSAGAIDLVGGTISAGSGGLTLTAAGKITQTGGGLSVATGAALSGSSVGGADFTGGTNNVTDFGAFSNTGSGLLSFTNARELSAGGLSSAGGITLTTTGAGSNLSLGALSTPGQTVTLNSAGTISEQLGTIITAATLTGSSVGSATVDQANQIGTLGGFDSGGSFSFTDTRALTASGVGATGALTLTTTGAGSNLTLGGNLSAPGSTLSLVSGGTISQTGGTITAGTLTGSSVGAASFGRNGNQVATLGAFTTANGNLTLVDTSALSIAGLVGAGTGTIALSTTGGGISEAAGGILDPGALEINSAGAVSLGNANTVDALAASVTGSGAAFLFNNTANPLTIGTVSGVSGITTSNGAVTLSVVTSGGLTINQPVNAGTGMVTAASVGDLALGAAGTVTGGPITLATHGNFTNNAGANALTAGGGNNWLVYSTNPANDNDGGLTPAFIQYAATYPIGTAGTPTPPAAAGDGLLYSLAPQIAVNSVTKIYDGTTAMPTNAGAYSIGGGINGDRVALNAGGASGAYASANVGSGIAVTLNGLSVTATNNGIQVFGYTLFAANDGFIGAITPAALSAAIVGNPTKTYDGTTTATLASANYSLSGFVGSEGATVTQPVGTYASANAASGVIVTAALAAANFTANNGTQLSNYILPTSAAGTGTINRATLTAGLTGTVSKTYDGTTAATLVPANYTLAGIIGGDIVSLNDPTAGVYASKNVGSAIGVSVTGLALNGASSLNYVLASTSANANIGTIAAATLTAGLIGAVSKVYDGTTAAALAPANYTLSGVIGGDTVVLNNPTAGTYASKNVGSAIGVSVAGLALSGASAGNYVLASTAANANIGTITAATLTAGLTGTVSKVFDGTAAATLAPSNYTLSGVIGGDSVSLNDPTSGIYASKDVGAGIGISVTGLALSGVSAGNYVLALSSANANIGIITAPIIPPPPPTPPTTMLIFSQPQPVGEYETLTTLPFLSQPDQPLIVLGDQ